MLRDFKSAVPCPVFHRDVMYMISVAGVGAVQSSQTKFKVYCYAPLLGCSLSLLCDVGMVGMGGARWRASHTSR